MLNAFRSSDLGCYHLDVEVVYTSLALCGLQVLGTVLARVQNRCGALLEATMAPQSGLQGFDFLGNSILAAIDQQVANSLPGISVAKAPVQDFVCQWIPYLCIIAPMIAWALLTPEATTTRYA